MFLNWNLIISLLGYPVGSSELWITALITEVWQEHFGTCDNLLVLLSDVCKEILHSSNGKSSDLLPNMWLGIVELCGARKNTQKMFPVTTSPPV